MSDDDAAALLRARCWRCRRRARVPCVTRGLRRGDCGRWRPACGCGGSWGQGGSTGLISAAVDGRQVVGRRQLDLDLGPRRRPSRKRRPRLGRRRHLGFFDRGVGGSGCAAVQACGSPLRLADRAWAPRDNSTIEGRFVVDWRCCRTCRREEEERWPAHAAQATTPPTRADRVSVAPAVARQRGLPGLPFRR